MSLLSVGFRVLCLDSSPISSPQGCPMLITLIPTESDWFRGGMGQQESGSGFY